MTLPVPRTLLPGFQNPVADAQRVFAAVMRALSRPGRIVELDARLSPPAPLSPEIAAILLALADHETAVWLDATLRAAPAVQDFLTFHTGLRLVPQFAAADYVVASAPALMPPLAELAQGTPEYPDRSATVLLQVAAFRAQGLRIEGPGIADYSIIGFEGMPGAFADELAANRASYPCGVDLLLAAPDTVVGIPRSMRLAMEG